MIVNILIKIQGKLQSLKIKSIEKKLGYFGKNAYISGEFVCGHPENIFIHENSHIFGPFMYIGNKGKFVVKMNSGAAQGLTVICGGHKRSIGKLLYGGETWEGRSSDHDIIVEEDVWIGTNVTLCAGVTIGRCSNIGAGSVVRHDVPPYAIVMGNPAKVTGFCFTPEEVIEHEKVLYSEEERLPIELLEKNYEKFFLKRLKEIKDFTKL